MGGGSIGRRSAASEPQCERRPRSMATPKKKGRERHTANTTHPGLLGLLSYAEIVLAGPVHDMCSGERMNRRGATMAREGKRDLDSGLGPVLKYWQTTA